MGNEERFPLVNEKNSIKVQVPCPDGFALKESIDHLLEMYPIVGNNQMIDFLEQEETMHTWIVKGKNPIKMMRIGEELYYQITFEDLKGKEELIIKKISNPNNARTLLERIAWVMKRHPSVCYINNNEFMLEFKEESIEEKSAVDGKTVLDMNHWCVTLFNSENKHSMPCSWMGHASLIIETVEKGGIFF